MRRARSAVSVKSGQFAFAFHNLRVGIENLRKFTMQTDTDMGGLTWKLVHQALGGTHDEFEMGDIVALVRTDHQEIILLRRTPVQSISSVEHEDFEGCHTMFGDE